MSGAAYRGGSPPDAITLANRRALSEQRQMIGDRVIDGQVFVPRLVTPDLTQANAHAALLRRALRRKVRVVKVKGGHGVFVGSPRQRRET